MARKKSIKTTPKFTSFEHAKSSRNEYIWEQLREVTVKKSISDWMSTLSENTKKNYLSGMNRLIELGFINDNMTLQQFSLLNHNNILDDIKTTDIWSESTKQSRSATFISFTHYLSRKTLGIVSRVTPSKEGLNCMSSEHFRVIQLKTKR